MFNLEHLDNLRRAEIDKIAQYLTPGSHVLEIGAGTGRQAKELSERGLLVEAIELSSAQPDSTQYAQERVFPVLEYDGRNIPFPNWSFDVVFSSNVLEHIQDLKQIHTEIRRVLRPAGYALHVLPTHAWRFWTAISCLPNAFQYLNLVKGELCPRSPLGRAEFSRVALAWSHLGMFFKENLSRHGERGMFMTEFWYFRPGWWRRNFRANGFEIIKDEPMGLFYTGNMTIGAKLSLQNRGQLAKVLGSACHLFQIRVANDTG
jgi:SAM-dependent methyltransferase